jgi:hypothetical protein
MTEVQRSEKISDLDSYIGAGDGNRTRTISLGICAIRSVVRPNLRFGVSASDRERPLDAGVNGTLMARRPSLALRLKIKVITESRCEAVPLGPQPRLRITSLSHRYGRRFRASLRGIP